MHEVLEKLEGHEEHGDSPLTLPVTVTLAIIAVLVAMVTLLGHRAQTFWAPSRPRTKRTRAYCVRST
jgi:hypothetical protein